MKQGKFIANDMEVLEFVLEKCKNGIPVMRQTIRMEIWKDAKSWRFHSKNMKPVMAGQYDFKHHKHC